MTRRATFTQAELTRAIRAAQATGVVARLRETGDGPVIEFIPPDDAAIDRPRETGNLDQPKQW